jgi:hypothetical protein
MAQILLPEQYDRIGSDVSEKFNDRPPTHRSDSAQAGNSQ